MSTRFCAALIASVSLFGSACGQQPTQVVAGSETENRSPATTMLADVPDTRTGDSVAAPETSPDPDPQPGDGPPRAEERIDHELAPLALTAAALGEEWEIDFIEIVEPGPADGDNMVCGVPAPAQLYGLEIEMSSANGELVQAIGRGTQAEAQAWLSAFEALAGCDGSEESDFMTSAVFSPDVAGADDAIGVDFTVADSDPMAVRFVGARFGNVFVFIGSSADSPDLVESVEWLEGHVAWSGAQL